LLGNGDCTPGDGDVVIGGEQRDQAENEAADGLGEAKAVKAWAGDEYCWPVWRSRRLLAGGWWPGATGAWGHGCEAIPGCGSSTPSVPPLALVRHTHRGLIGRSSSFRPAHPDHLLTTEPAAPGRTGTGLGWWEWGRVGLVRKAVLPDQGAQSLLPGVFARQLQDLALEPLHALLVTAIASPVEHRQQLSPPRQG